MKNKNLHYPFALTLLLLACLLLITTLGFTKEASKTEDTVDSFLTGDLSPGKYIIRSTWGGTDHNMFGAHLSYWPFFNVVTLNTDHRSSYNIWEFRGTGKANTFTLHPVNTIGESVLSWKNADPRPKLNLNINDPVEWRFELVEGTDDRYRIINTYAGSYNNQCVSWSNRSNLGLGNTVTINQSDPVDWQVTSMQDYNFVMAFASDPQLGYDPNNDSEEIAEHPYFNEIPKNSIIGNLWHSASIETLKKEVIRNGGLWKGVVINGDMTNTRDDDNEYPFYKEYYLDKFWVYPGLGNHDHDDDGDLKYCNNYGEEGESHIIGKGVCDKRVYDRFVETVKSIPGVQNFDYEETNWERKGSRAYSWTIGNYHFIQLNNNPAYTMKAEIYNSARVGTETYSFSDSFEWLKKELDDNKDKKIILNMHGMSRDEKPISDNFGPEKHYDIFGVKYYVYKDKWNEFKAILDNHNNVVAIFAGHIHSWVGQMECSWDSINKKMGYTDDWSRDRWTIETTSGRKIDIFYCGGAEWNHYLKVKFHPNKLVVTPIYSAYGFVSPASNNKTWTVNH